MQKTFKCLSCQRDIRLERKPDDSGWNKFNLDGTPHIDQKKQKQNQQQQRQQQPAVQPQVQQSDNNVQEAIALLRQAIKLLEG